MNENLTEQASPISLRDIIGKLIVMFTKFNRHFYGGELNPPMITVSPEHRNGVLGWCTSWKAWKDAKEDGYYEVNLCSEYLSRPFAEIAETLLHEMVHLSNLQNDVKDVSRGGTYHNKRFKETAEQHGLEVEKGNSGWNRTKLTDKALAWITSEYADEQGFGLYREKMLKLSVASNSKSSSRKYVCPMCGTIVRATKEVHITCADCGVNFEEQ